jgi:branched-chain amino acid aminotransferase
VLSPDRRDPRGPLVGIKTISYAGERLLLARARAAGADECLRRNLEGRVCEGTRSNVFLIEGDRLVTPPLTEGLLPGVTRWFLLTIARDAGLTPREEEVPVPRLLAADEAFLTSTLRGVVPLVAVDGRALGAGVPGPRAVRLALMLERHTTRGFEP